jgi:hypothetical protein
MFRVHPILHDMGFSIRDRRHSSTTHKEAINPLFDEPYGIQRPDDQVTRLPDGRAPVRSITAITGFGIDTADAILTTFRR